MESHKSADDRSPRFRHGAAVKSLSRLGSFQGMIALNLPDKSTTFFKIYRSVFALCATRPHASDGKGFYEERVYMSPLRLSLTLYRSSFMERMLWDMPVIARATSCCDRSYSFITRAYCIVMTHRSAVYRVR